jgi:hypothetical protein
MFLDCLSDIGVALCRQSLFFHPSNERLTLIPCRVIERRSIYKNESIFVFHNGQHRAAALACPTDFLR